MDNQTLLKNSFKQAIRELEKEDKEEKMEEREDKIAFIFFILGGFTFGIISFIVNSLFS